MKDSIPQDKSISWAAEAQAKFRQMLERMPIFARPMAEKPVARKAEELAGQTQGQLVTEEILIDAFFEITPFGFHGPLMSDMEAVELDYKGCGHPKDYS